MASLPPIWSGAPGPEVTLSYVELQATDGRANLGLREPTAAERTLGAAVESRGSPGPMLVHAFALTPDLVEDNPVQPVGPGRPWAEFRRAIVDEAVRRRPPT